jgi:hypothetical protein
MADTFYTPSARAYYDEKLVQAARELLASVVILFSLLSSANAEESLVLVCNGTIDVFQEQSGKRLKSEFSSYPFEIDFENKQASFFLEEIMTVSFHNDKIIYFNNTFPEQYDYAYGELNRSYGRGSIDLRKGGELAKRLSFDCR